MLAIVAIAVSSCQKELSSDSATTPQPVGAHASNYRTTGLPTVPSTTDFAILVKRSQDAEDELNNKVALHLSVGLTEVLKNTTYAQWIHTQTAAAPTNEISVTHLLEQFPEIGAMIEEATDPLGTYSGYSFAELNTLLAHNGVHLNAGIFLVNAGETQANGRSLLIPGFTVPDRDSLGDMYMAWDIARDGSHTRVGVGEDGMMTLNVPVYSIIFRPDDFVPDVPTPLARIQFPANPRCDEEFYAVGGLRINHSFEGDDWSEVEMIAGRYNGSYGNWSEVMRVDECGKVTKDHNRIKNIYKNDLNKYNFSGEFIGYTDDVSGPRDIWFQTYERDVPGPSWTIAVLPSYGLNMPGRMKYQEEYYGYPVGDVQQRPMLPNQIPNVGNWYEHYSLSKGFLHVDHKN